MLEVFLVLAFVFLQLSLLATTIQELIASLCSLRGITLRSALKKMLQHKENTKHFNEFEKNPFYKQLRTRILFIPRFPSYLEASTFRRILIDSILSRKDQEKNYSNSFDYYESSIKGLDGELKEVLSSLLKEARYEGVRFEDKIEQWYSETMKRITGWYKKKVQFLLIVIGFGLAVALDADTIEMYQKLSALPELELYANTISAISTRDSSLGVEEFGERHRNIFQDLRAPLGMDGLKDAIQNEIMLNPNNKSIFQDTVVLDNSGMAKIFQKIQSFKVQDSLLVNIIPFTKEGNLPENDSVEIEATQYAAITINKKGEKKFKLGSNIWGWLLTALLVSLGAPFWFDLLKKLIHIRNAGKKPTSIDTPSEVTSKKIEFTESGNEIVG